METEKADGDVVLIKGGVDWPEKDVRMSVGKGGMHKRAIIGQGGRKDEMDTMGDRSNLYLNVGVRKDFQL